jgi:hypothetical protein
MAKAADREPEDHTVTSLAEVRSEKEELAAFLEDIKGGTDAAWEPVVVPAWNGRTVHVRSLTTGERSRLRREGYKALRNEEGDMVLQETEDLEPLLIELSCYADIGGKKHRLFKSTADSRLVLKRQKAGTMDELISTALRLAGLSTKADEEAGKDSTASLTAGPDSDSPEIWD